MLNLQIFGKNDGFFLFGIYNRKKMPLKIK